MRILYVSGLGQVWGEYSPDILDNPEAKGTVAGGEAAFLQTAFALAERHGVDVMSCYPGQKCTYRGVQFEPLDQGHVLAGKGDYDAIVSWGDGIALTLAPKSRKRIFSQQLNLLPQVHTVWDAMDLLVSPSKTHGIYLLANYAPPGVTRKPAHFTVSNALDTVSYADAPPFEQRPLYISHWSSPDRGLHHLLRMWPTILEAQPEAQLHVFYHPGRFIAQASGKWHLGELAWRAHWMREMDMTRMPNVVLHGPTPRHELAKWQKQTRVYAFPLDTVFFTEGFCIAPGEALAAGARVAMRPQDAVEEVYGDSVRWVRGPVLNRRYYTRFIDAVLDELTRKDNPRAEGVARVVKQYTWANAGAQMFEAINSIQK